MAEWSSFRERLRSVQHVKLEIIASILYSQGMFFLLYLYASVFIQSCVFFTLCPGQSKGESEEVGETGDSGEYNVYSTFQSHEPDFDYLKSLEIEEKINKIRWLPQQNAAHFLLSTNGENPVTPGDQADF